nr:hypothetical protein [Moritella viscosa]SHO14487.1 tRNA(Ile)-lysidine synthase-tRNA(Ile)-2-lysyl-cytidine synthase-tRNA(Ile)-lysidine synthetase [Moritella viscosa]
MNSINLKEIAIELTNLNKEVAKGITKTNESVKNGYISRSEAGTITNGMIGENLNTIFNEYDLNEDEKNQLNALANKHVEQIQQKLA